MKVHRERYQHGSIRRVKRAKGFAWSSLYLNRRQADTREPIV